MAISCRKAQKLINKYLDNEFNDNQLHMLNLHLEVCSKCKKDYEALKTIKSDLNEMGLCELPKDFTSSLHLKLVYESLNVNEKKKFTFRPLVNAAVSFALILCVGIGSGLYFNNTNEPEQISETNDATVANLAYDQAMTKARINVFYGEYTVDISGNENILNDIALNFVLNDDNTILCNDETFIKLNELLLNNNLTLQLVNDREADNLIRFIK